MNENDILKIIGKIADREDISVWAIFPIILSISFSIIIIK